ncbi:MAG: aromatic amino acid hydroxylase, partial [Bdellovibrionales bacterium]|nr:aromatic amino acid hydroxylase [Bdellovibrionales bacterium]
HEAAGHAPILINSEFADYLKRYAEIARKAIISKEDLDQYEAIRILSDVKENPESTPEEVQRAEKHLEKVSSAITKISEAGWLSRMNWWTAEYGLIGDLKKPKIFGAGLLSSVGEARQCLGDSVKKIPLTVDCVETGYDITEPQPQLFVTPNFETLHKVLEDLADKMAFRLGGEAGLSRALEARTINTVQLDSGLQISGELETFKLDDKKQPCFIKLKGPSQISYNYHQIEGQGPDYHGHGYSTPLGSFNGWHPNDGPLTLEKLKVLGIQENQPAKLKYDSGIIVAGVVNQIHNIDGEPKLIQLTSCKVEWNHETLFQPEWGPFDLALGNSVTSVFAGPADRNFLNDSADFVAARVPIRKYSQEEQKTHTLFYQLRKLRETQSANAENLKEILENWSRTESKNWLVGLEILELLNNLNGTDSLKESVKKIILTTNDSESESYFLDGYRLIKH